MRQTRLQKLYTLLMAPLFTQNIRTSRSRRNILNLLDIQNKVANKRVLLVGNNLTALEKEQGELIDSYDIVVRFGKGIFDIKKYEKYIGTKTDIWSTGGFRQSLRDHAPKDALVLFNPGGAREERVTIPSYPYILMYTTNEIENINKKYNQKPGKRLSNGAITAHFFVDKVATYKSLTFINFDMFTVYGKFFNNFLMQIDYSQSWHMPTPIKGSYDKNKNGEDHPAHDSKTEKALFEDLCKAANVSMLGDIPEKVQRIKINRAPWDDRRQKLEDE